MRAIILNDFLRNLFSLRTYVLGAGFIAIALYFFLNLLASYNAEVQRFISTMNVMNAAPPRMDSLVIQKYIHSLNFVLLFFVPIFVSSSFIDEKNQGTLYLLQASTLASYRIVCGKFLAFFALQTFLLILAFLIPLTLAWLMPLHIPGLLCGFLSLFCVMAIATAISLWASLRSHTAPGAILASFAPLLLLYMLHTPAELMEGVQAELLTNLSLLWQTRSMVQGLIDVSTLCYVGGLLVFFLYLTTQSFSLRRGTPV